LLAAQRLRRRLRALDGAAQAAVLKEREPEQDRVPDPNQIQNQIPFSAMGINVGQILRQTALRMPERVAIRDVGLPGSTPTEHSYADLDARACAVATRLGQLGLTLGDSVALIGENSADFVAAWFGCAYAGCALVPIPLFSAPPELRFRVEHAGCRAVLFDATCAELVAAALAGLDAEPQRLVLSDALATPSTAITVQRPADPPIGETALLLYTSGTTGTPKGAAISHASLALHTAILSQRVLGLHADDRVLGVLPLTHSYGCRMAMLVTFFAGARVVLMPPRFDAERSLQLMHDEAISWVPAVPTMLARWGGLPDGPAPAALRWALCAGAPLANETARRAERRLGVEVRQGYGMTEATFCTINAPPDQRVLGSVGKPVWGIDVRVVDEHGADVAPGSDGEVVVRGHNAMTRYLHDPDATLAVSAGGFLHTGDVGRFDGEGRLAIVDRIKDLIIRGGYNIYPSEVEAVLATHEGVQDVAVVGRPDEDYGEEVVAVVVRRPGSSLAGAELLLWAKAELGRMKRPREVAFVESMPLGPSGKVQKRTLRQWLADGTLHALHALH
jgi:long-chain acyl-CoA synthetase